MMYNIFTVPPEEKKMYETTFDDLTGEDYDYYVDVFLSYGVTMKEFNYRPTDDRGYIVAIFESEDAYYDFMEADWWSSNPR